MDKLILGKGVSFKNTKFDLEGTTLLVYTGDHSGAIWRWRINLAKNDIVVRTARKLNDDFKYTKNRNLIPFIDYNIYSKPLVLDASELNHKKIILHYEENAENSNQGEVKTMQGRF